MVLKKELNQPIKIKRIDPGELVGQNPGEEVSRGGRKRRADSESEGSGVSKEGTRLAGEGALGRLDRVTEEWRANQWRSAAHGEEEERKNYWRPTITPTKKKKTNLTSFQIRTLGSGGGYGRTAKEQGGVINII